MEVRVYDASEELEVGWKDGGKRRYPFVWLRDCCQCPSCFHTEARSRQTDLGQLDLDAKPRTVEPEADGDAIKVTWTDGHVSVFEVTWLKRHLFGVSQRLAGVLRYQKEPKLWGSEILQNFPSISFDSILTDDIALYKWMTVLEETGICRLTGAPAATGQIRKIAARVAYLRSIHYGDLFDITDKADPSNVSYTAVPLPLHTDTPYLTYVPGMQMLHCISNCKMEGGENQFTDGFHAAEQLRQQHPEYFQLLSAFKIDFYDIGNDFLPFYMRARHNIIEVDEDGSVVRISFSHHARDTVLRLPVEKVKMFYKALRTFYDLLRHPKNLIEVKLQPGDIFCFHNYRILHARSGFMMATGERYLQGGYIDWDEMLSRRRVLEAKLHIHETDDHI